MTAWDVIAEVGSFSPGLGYVPLGNSMAEKIVSSLSATGYSIVHESEIHGATKQRCIAAVEAIEIVVPLTPGAPDGASIALQLAIEAIRALPDGGVDD